MENVQSRARLHPLVAGAAAAVIIAAAVAVAAIGGYLPGSKAQQNSVVSNAKAIPPAGHERSGPAVCTECGVVISVSEKTIMGKGTGVGAIAGGVAGAVIGHDIGENRAGTAIGAVVGGIAGHQIERSARSTKRYDVAVRMQDGSVKTVSSGTPPPWRAGDRVRLHNGVLKPA